MNNHPVLNEDTFERMSAAVGPEGCARLVGIFVEETRLRLERIEQLAAGNDFTTLHLEAHSLKGASATYGADALSALALKLEKACDAEDRDRIKELAPTLKMAGNEAMAQLVAFLASG